MRAEFRKPRDEMGTQDPLVTLNGAADCRDFTLFLMEAARSLGFAARFVSGYLYDEDRVNGGEARGRRRRDACLGAALSSWGRMGGVRSDHSLVGGRNLDPCGGHPRSQPGHPAQRHVHRPAPMPSSGMTVEVQIKAEPRTTA